MRTVESIAPPGAPKNQSFQFTSGKKVNMASFFFFCYWKITTFERDGRIYLP